MMGCQVECQGLKGEREREEAINHTEERGSGEREERKRDSEGGER